MTYNLISVHDIKNAYFRSPFIEVDLRAVKTSFLASIPYLKDFERDMYRDCEIVVLATITDDGEISKVDSCILSNEIINDEINKYEEKLKNKNGKE